MNTPSQILFVRQRHDAKRAGLHNDYRVVIGDKAFSWASKKDFPEVGKPTILWEQPVHHASYLNNPDITIPEGQYGAGRQVIDYAQKGSATVGENVYHLDLNNGDRFLIKKAPDSYGEKAWLFMRKNALSKVSPELEKVAIPEKNEVIGGDPLAHAAYRYLNKKASENPYLEKAAALGNKDMESARAHINKKREEEGKSEIGYTDFKDQFEDRRGISRRVVGTIGLANVGALLGQGSPVGAIAGGVAGYYLGKSFDNKNARKNLIKEADDKRNSGTLFREGAAGLVGAGVVADAPSKLLGYHNIYHGTSKENAKNILKNGLRKAHGGTRGSKVGTGAERDAFVSTAKKHVYMTKNKMVARTFAGDSAKFINEHGHNSNETAFKAVVDGLKNGKVLKARVSHNQYRKGFEMDPDSFDAMTRMFTPHDRLKDTAARSRRDIGAHQFSGGKGSKGIGSFLSKNNLKRYYGSANGRARAAMGAAQLVGGSALIGGAAFHHKVTNGPLARSEKANKVT